MRESKVLKAIAAGKVATCVEINFSDSRAVEIAALFGFDCIWTDMEHVALDWKDLEGHALGARAGGVDLMVRVAKGSYSEYVKPLELDAAGIMVPHVMDGKEARSIAEITKFHPIGRRALYGLSSDSAFGNMDLGEYLKKSNESHFVIAQIEDKEALPYLEEIASVDGIDMLFFGPADYSQSLGIPGDIYSPAVCEARQAVVKASWKYGKPAGTVSDFAHAQCMVDIGYRFLNIGVDVYGLNEYYLKVKEIYDNLKY